MASRKPNGYCNHLIEEAVSRGLRYDNGKLLWPDGRELHQTLSRRGYKVVSLGLSKCRRSFNSARVICWLHHGPPPGPNYHADHINRDKLDDSPENLRWATPSQNALNISDESRKRMADQCKFNPRKRHFGESHPLSTLTREQVLAIRGSNESQRVIARKFGIAQSTVSKIKRGVRWPAQSFLP